MFFFFGGLAEGPRLLLDQFVPMGTSALAAQPMVYNVQQVLDITARQVFKLRKMGSVFLSNLLLWIL
jgi:hypothetical protein